MTFNVREQEIINWGVTNGKSKNEVKQALIRFRLTGSPADLSKQVEEEPSGLIETIKDIPSDIQEAFTGATEAVSGAMEEAGKIRERVEEGKTTPVAGTLQTIGRGLRAGVETIEEGVMGLGKTFLSPYREEQIGEVVEAGVEKIVQTKPAQEILSRYQQLSPEEQRNIQGVLGIGGGLTTAFGVPFVSKAGSVIKKSSSELFKKALDFTNKYTPKKLRNTTPKELADIIPTDIIGYTKNYLSRKNVGETLEKSVIRLADEEPIKKYNEFRSQELKFKENIKEDTAIGLVGERIGNAYEKIINVRRAVGKKMSSELQKIKDIQTNVLPVIDSFVADLSESGLSFDRVLKKIKTTTSQSKMGKSDIGLLEDYAIDLQKMGSKPTVGDIDSFISRINQDLKIYKGRQGIIGTTNAERIIKKSLSDLRNQFSPEINSKFTGYHNARQKYSELSDFLEEGERFLGKKTQTGDFAKDASIAKSSVQSILNNGKKDWLLTLEDLTGYQALDESVLALQAMKDAGNFRGQSLLESLTEGSQIPTSARDLATKFVEFGAKKAGEKFVGQPSEQTIRVIEGILNSE